VDIALEVLGSAAPTARHQLYDLLRLAVQFVLDHVANIDEALIAAVGPLVGENFRCVGAYTSGVHSASYSVGRVPWCATTAGAIFTSSVYYKYLHTSTNMIGYFL
jgi:hypothetical protein